MNVNEKINIDFDSAGDKGSNQSTFSMVTMSGFVWWFCGGAFFFFFFLLVFPSHRPSTSEGIPHPREIFCLARFRRNGLSPASNLSASIQFYCHPGSLFLFSFPSFGLGTGLFDDFQLPLCIISPLISFLFSSSFFFFFFPLPHAYGFVLPRWSKSESCRMTA